MVHLQFFLLIIIALLRRMNLYEQYLDGAHEAVYEEIYKLGDKAFDSEYKKEVDKVLQETFERVSFNLKIIYKELIKLGYLFNIDCQFNFEKPLHEPLENTENLIGQLDRAVSSFGYVPLSLKYFYRIVGGVNFVWDLAANNQLMWDLADPIQVASLDSVVEQVCHKY